ncbi:MAG: DUF2905 domain-containing protein [Chloroflexota bacterium]|jgi:hypothetical protein
MQNFELVGRWLVWLGIGLVIIGVVFWLVGRLPGAQNLPGTIIIERENFTCIIPLAASIVISVLLTLLLNFLARINNR